MSYASDAMREQMTATEWAEYEQAAAADYEAELNFWRELDAAPQPALDAGNKFHAMLVALVGRDEMHALLELQDLREGAADADFWRGGA